MKKSDKKTCKMRAKKTQKNVMFVDFFAVFFSPFLLIFEHCLVYFYDNLAIFCAKKNDFGVILGPILTLLGCIFGRTFVTLFHFR